MSGYITFWSKEYVKKIEQANDTGPLCVVYGSHHLKMPSISSLRSGDIFYPVAIREKTLCIMARLPIEKIEPAFIYLMCETGRLYSALVPDGITIDENSLFPVPHKFHQEPITCCASLAASGTQGSAIFPRPIPPEQISELRFGKTPSSQKPLKLDKNGNLTSISISGFTRKMSEETFRLFESFFQ